jgi:putative SOS response-associated peptidase YedK
VSRACRAQPTGRFEEETTASEDELLALLRPCPDDVLKIWPVGKAVGKAVGNVKNTGPQLVMPV